MDEFIDVDRSVKEVNWAKPGTKAGLEMLETFCQERLKYFATDRNNPTKSALSNLSPWFHAGEKRTKLNYVCSYALCAKNAVALSLIFFGQENLW